MTETTKSTSLTAGKDAGLVDISDFSDEEKSRVKEIAGGLEPRDSQAVVLYGSDAQREIADFSDDILNEVRAKDSGHVGDILTNMLMKVKELDVDSISAGGGIMSKIPLLGGLVDQGKRFIARYEKLSVQIENIVDELEKSRTDLIRDIAMMDQMYEKNLAYLRNLEVYIAAGQVKIKELEEQVLPELKKKAETSNDPLDAQHYQDFQQFINRLDKKLHDLKLSRAIAIQTTPQVRLIQGGNQELAEKIQGSIMNTIPLWKNQVVIALTLLRQKKALKLQQDVADTTNELLQANAAMLKEGTTEIARESQRGIVDLETLQKVNESLLSTIEETLKIQQEGREKRRQAEEELGKIETGLKEKLISLKTVEE